MTMTVRISTIKYVTVAQSGRSNRLIRGRLKVQIPPVTPIKSNQSKTSLIGSGDKITSSG